jgi:hypothetical protein
MLFGLLVHKEQNSLIGKYLFINSLFDIEKILFSEWIIDELNRHRPLLGDCLSSFASCFPVAFFEPEVNVNNKHASNVSQLSPEANGKIF